MFKEEIMLSQVVKSVSGISLPPDCANMVESMRQQARLWSEREPRFSAEGLLFKVVDKIEQSSDLSDQEVALVIEACLICIKFGAPAERYDVLQEASTILLKIAHAWEKKKKEE